MKNLLRHTLALAVLTIATALHAQEEIFPTYFTAEEMPDMVQWLPAPPDTTSSAFIYDITQYFWGKQQRLEPERAQMAIDDANWTVEYLAQIFSEPFGMTLSREHTPEIYRLLGESVFTIRLSGTAAKAHYMRRRPFMRFQEHMLTPWDEEELSTNGSYPSGHTLRGFGAALVLMQINPEAANALLSRGMEYGQSRVIVGAHWQSDVDAGRLGASAAFARLQTSPDYLRQLQRAQAEYARLKKQADKAK